MGPKELTRISRMTAVLGAAMCLGAVLLFSPAVALGVTVGAALAAANLFSVRYLVTASLRKDGLKRAALQLLLMGKMGLLFVMVFLAIRFLPINPIALAVGMSVFLVAIAVESLRFSMSPTGNDERAPDGRA